MNFQRVEENKKIILNFSKASSSRSPGTLPLDSLTTNKLPSNGTPFSRISEPYSLNQKYSNSNLNKHTARNNLFRKVPTKYEKSLRRQKLKSVKDASMNLKFIRKVGKVENFGIQRSQSEIKKTKNFLLVVYMVKKFIQIIKTYTFVKKIFHLKAYHFNVIGDSSNFYQRGSEFGEKFFGNITNRTSQNYVIKNLYIIYSAINVLGQAG